MLYVFFRESWWSYNPSVNDVLFCWFLTCNWGLCPQLEEHWPWYWSGRDWFSSFTSSHSSLCKNLCSMFRQRSREWTTTVNHYCHGSRYRKRVSSMCLYGNRTKWSPIRSEIIQVINKIEWPHSRSLICLITSMSDYRPIWRTQSSVTN